MGLAGFYLIGGTHTSPSTWCNNNAANTNPCSAANPFNFADDLPSDCTISFDGACHIGSQVTFPSVQGGAPLGDCSTPGPGLTPGPGIFAGNCLLLPLAITDKAFNLDGSLKFSENGNTIVVNGKTWPFANVQPRKYQVRIVIAAPTSRFDLTFPTANNDLPGAPTVTVTQIGADSGLLPHPVLLTKPLSLMPGERAELIVDFSAFWACNYPNPPDPTMPACQVQLLNSNGTGDTGQVMQFGIVPFPNCSSLFDGNGNIAACAFPPTSDTSCNLPYLSCTKTDTLPHRASEVATKVRQVSLFDDHLGNCPNAGCVNSKPLPWDGAVTETPTLRSTEIWEMYDFMDQHPMHLHESQFEILGRVDMKTGAVTPPGPGETGFKDTVIANGGQITRVRVTFQGPVGPTSDATPAINPGLFAWHCHINPHEDDEMMRPMCVQFNDGLHNTQDQTCAGRP